MRAKAQTLILNNKVMPCTENFGGETSKEPDPLMSPLYYARFPVSNLFKP